MKRFRVVAYRKSRHEVEVDAEDQQGAIDAANDIAECDWSEDAENYEFKVDRVEEVA
jgi:hypothetical protein